MKRVAQLTLSAKRRQTLAHYASKRKKVRKIPLNTTARSSLNHHLETLPSEYQYLLPSEKTQEALTGQALGYLVTKYAAQAQVTDLSPHDLRHRFGYRMAEVVPLHRIAQIMGHDSLDTIFEGPSKTCNRTWRKSHGYKIPRSWTKKTH